MILIIGLCLGIVDYLIKGTEAWNKLPSWFQGWSWHITLVAVYVLCIVAYSLSHDNMLALIGILGIINEDFGYWLAYWIDKNELKIKPPGNLLNIRGYIICLLLINLIIYLVMERLLWN